LPPLQLAAAKQRLAYMFSELAARTLSSFR
jgi:hypothetical protein